MAELVRIKRKEIAEVAAPSDNHFVRFVRAYRHGALADQLADSLRDAVAMVEETGGEAEIVLRLNLTAMDRGVIQVADEVSVTTRQPRLGAILRVTPENELIEQPRD